MVSRRLSAAISTVVAVLVACGGNHQLCSPVPAPNVDSAYALAAPLRLSSDSTLSPDSIVGVVLRAGQRSPIAGAEVRFRSDIARATRSDSAGRFALSVPQSTRTVLETRSLGYLWRRDTLNVPTLRNQRLEVLLLDAYTFGDIQPMICKASNPLESP